MTNTSRGPSLDRSATGGSLRHPHFPGASTIRGQTVMSSPQFRCVESAPALVFCKRESLERRSSDNLGPFSWGCLVQVFMTLETDTGLCARIVIGPPSRLCGLLCCLGKVAIRMGMAGRAAHADWNSKREEPYFVQRVLPPFLCCSIMSSCAWLCYPILSPTPETLLPNFLSLLPILETLPTSIVDNFILFKSCFSCVWESSSPGSV